MAPTLRVVSAVSALAVARAVILHRRATPAATANVVSASVQAPPWRVNATEHAKWGVCGCELGNATLAVEDQCSCKATLDYTHCVAAACHNGCDDPGCHAGRFFETCGHVNDKCNHELDFHCSLDEAVCLGKYHQDSNGTMGLKLVKTHEMTLDVRCGPHAKCQGSLKISAELLKATVNDTWMECTIPRVLPHDAPLYAPDSVKGIHAPTRDWLNCKTVISDNTSASCEIPMDEIELEMFVKMKGSCWLEDVNGTHLTQNAHFLVENIHPNQIAPCDEYTKQYNHVDGTAQ